MSPPLASLARRYWTHASSIALIALIGLAAFRMEIVEDVGALLSTVRIHYLILGAGLFFLGHVLRTKRLLLLLSDRSPPFSRIFCWSGLHAVWNYLLPARTGEFSLVVYLHHYEKEPVARTLALLVGIRTLEVLWTLALVPVVLLPLREPLGAGVSWALSSASFLAIAAIVGAVALIRKRESLRANARRRSYPTSRVRTHLHRVAGHLRAMTEHPARWPVVAVTLSIWLANLAVFYLCFVMFGVSVPAHFVLALMIGMAAVQVMPIQGFANLGSHELIWVAVLMLAGLSSSFAVTLAIATHVVYFGYVGVLAGLVLFIQRIVVFGVPMSGFMPRTGPHSPR